MSAAEIGNSSTVEKKMTSVSRPSMCLQGRQDKASALQCSLIGQYSVSYVYMPPNPSAAFSPLLILGRPWLVP